VLSVEVDASEWSSPLGDLTVLASRHEDGWTTGATTDSSGHARLRVHPGTYDVAVDVDTSSGIVVSRASATVTVPGSGASVGLVMPRPARWRLRTESAGDLYILAEPNTGHVGSLDGLDGTEIEAPLAGPLHLRIERGARVRVVPVPEDVVRLAATGRIVDLNVTGIGDVEIRAALVDEDGSPVEGWLLDPEHDTLLEDPRDQPSADASGSPSCRTLEGESFRLVVWPRDRVRFQPTHMLVASARASGSPVMLGEVVVPRRRPTLRLVDASGEPLDRTVIVRAGERCEELFTTQAEDGHAGAVLDPWETPGLLVEGASVRVLASPPRGADGPTRVSWVRRLQGPGPWTLVEPRGRVVADPRDESGSAIAHFELHVDGVRFVAQQGTLEVGSLDAGSHELVVEAEGNVPRRLHLELADGETRSWAPTLRPSPR
jgi:hypothetical protein